VKYLSLHGANVEQANYKSTTALMRAAQEGHEHIVRVLLKYGARSVARKNLEKMSALMLASQRGHAQVVKMLICAGAEMDDKTAQDSTALMLACKRNHVQVAKVLVAAGCQLFLKDNLKRTARDTAQRKSFPELMELLRPSIQVQLMKRDVRIDRNHIMIQVWNLLQQERATLPFEDGCISIHQVADMDNSRALTLVETTETALIRTMTLPAPLVEHIAGFLPLPNLWTRRLEALTTTCLIDPDAAVICTLDLVDEILVEGGFIEALDSSGVPPFPTFQSWAQWKAWGTEWDGPHMKRIISMGTSLQGAKPGTERVGSEADDDAGERTTSRSAPYDERGRNGPTCRPKSTTMELRRAACFLQLLANSSPQLELTLTNQPYNMPHALLTKLAINRDMQSLVRRCIGVHFEVGVAADLVFMIRQLDT